MIITRDLTPDGIVTLWMTDKDLEMRHDGRWDDNPDSTGYISEMPVELFGIPLARGKKYKISTLEVIDD